MAKVRTISAGTDESKDIKKDNINEHGEHIIRVESTCIAAREHLPSLLYRL